MVNPTPTLKENIWKEARRTIFKRDGYRCRVFGCPARGAKQLTCHHILPRAEGGQHNPENLITLCLPHHNEIEIAGIRSLWQILNWSPGITTVSRDTLDATRGDEDPQANWETFIDDNEALRPPTRFSGFPHHCDQTTITAVWLLHERIDSWVAVASKLRCEPSFAPTLSAIGRGVPGSITKDGEIDLRYRIGQYAPEFCNWEFPQIVKSSVRLADSATQACHERIDQLLEQGYSWRDIAGIAGIPSGTAWHYWHGTARPDANFVLCIMNHNAAKCTLVLPCPDCGEIHDAGRCYNRPIFAVVILSPGQRVTALPKPPAKRRTPYAAISIPRALREELDRLRQARGETWEDLLSRLKVLAQLMEEKMATGNFSITFDVEPIVKVLCNEFDCEYNLCSDGQGGWAACNLKHLVIGRSGICASLRLAMASPRPPGSAVNETSGSHPAGDA